MGNKKCNGACPQNGTIPFTSGDVSCSARAGRGCTLCINCKKGAFPEFLSNTGKWPNRIRG